ncbi:hypothetical protein COU17_01230 [Candidatus Kaiserbacteria bacterium CG10_big_fil_rev_8_21_14_0_10_49_17]|uniref:Phosphatidic acid phosphatase type 2/haloperoxidase domain-containing protein n=1 Tax=Candidatus Kaiserbacteria bacterium CG10_big_fil_rev_8_21_14_0_10_49_17 TaxID=1974609 RepID=A0A2M6WEL9_9BACT|nr:MAG: hypothetical protein COU17_01230 [Candidatus Kaiserbacteria bacterium CG10_big_fil_rev_8_21_14_0_10_49_17]
MHGRALCLQYTPTDSHFAKLLRYTTSAMYELLVAISELLHSTIAEVLFFLVCAGLFFFLLLQKRRDDAYIFLLSLITTLGFVVLVKYTLATERPDAALVEANGFAFPSGHATAGMFLAVSFSYFFVRTVKEPRLRTLLTVLVFLIGLSIGLSRLLLLVHTPLQVAAGFLTAIIIPGGIYALYRNKRKKRASEQR